MRSAISLLKTAQYPTLLIGGGVIQAGAESHVQKLAEWLGAPVITTSSAKGVIPADHPLHLGVLASGGSVSKVFSDADLVMGLGTRVSHRDLRRVKAPPPRSFIHIG